MLRLHKQSGSRTSKKFELACSGLGRLAQRWGMGQRTRKEGFRPTCANEGKRSEMKAYSHTNTTSIGPRVCQAVRDGNDSGRGNEVNFGAGGV